MKRRRLAVALVAGALLAGETALAQSIVTNIAYAKRDENGDFFPDDPGGDYTVTGRVTSINFSTNATELYIQDPADSVGILVLSRDFVANSAAFPIGVMTRARGLIGQTNGVRCLLVSYAWMFETAGDTNPLAPLPRTIAELIADAERYEGTFVSISNVYLTYTNWPDWKRSSSNQISDGTGTLPLYIDSETDLDGQLPPEGTFSIRGIFSQYDRRTNVPPDAGYEIIPRFYTDIFQPIGQQPPQVSIYNSNDIRSAAVGRELVINVIGQDRNANDSLVLSAPQKPAAATFSYTNRVGELKWTPEAADAGTTNTLIFEVTDGIATSAAAIEIYVLSEELANITLNEVHWDPHPVWGDANGDGAVDTTQDEFVEIVNANTTVVDITGWVLRLGTSVLYTFPPAVLTGETAVVVFGGGAPAGDFGGALVLAPATNWPGLSNDPGGRPLNLVDPEGHEIFSYYYGTFGTPDQSITRNPDVAGDFVLHTNVVSFKRWSPGTMANGKAFPGAGITNTAPQLAPLSDVGVGVGRAVSCVVTSLDPEANNIFLCVSNAPTTATFVDHGDGSGLFAYTGRVEDVGLVFTVTVYAADGITNSSASFRLTVIESKYDGLVINEVLPDPDVTGVYLDSNNDGVTNVFQDEFIEIVNGTTNDLDLSGLILSDSLQIRHRFGSYVLPQGGAYVVFGGGSVANFRYPPAAVASSGGLGLDNAGDTVTLYTPQTSIIDRFTYNVQIQAQSWTRYPDITGDWANHYEVTGYTLRSSPGRKVDGSLFLSNQPPVLAAIGNKSVTVSNLLEFEVRATDVDGDLIELSASNLPANAFFYPTNGAGLARGSFTFVPEEAQAGNVYTTLFFATAVDGQDTQEVSIAVVSPGAGECAVIISEYVEGSGYNKAIEIYNGSGSTIDLAAREYYLMIYFNGSTFPSQSYALTGTVASGATYVVVPTNASETLLAYADQLIGGVWFNGDDAVVLRSGGTTGTVVDSIGQVGFDPGEEWGTGLVSTANNTLRRKPTVSSGDTDPSDPFDPALEWDGFAQDTFDGLGSHTNGCPTSHDTDGDGMDDNWELLHFGDLDTAGPGSNWDADQATDLEEYIADTNPKDAGSFYHTATAITNVAGGTMDLIAGPPTTNSRVYDAWWNTNLLQGDWYPLNLDVPGRADGGVLTLTVTNTPPMRFYRTGVKIP